MNSIKFSHEYEKMRGIATNGTIVVLLAVLKANLKELGADFVEYDTKIALKGNYELPTGELLILILKTPSNAIVTTIRRRTLKKEKYYKQQIGRQFKIEINNS